MIYARLKNGNWVIGVDAENIRRLTAGEDMLINFQAPGMPLVLMIYADDTEAIKARLEEASGAPLPPEGNTKVQ